MERSNNISRAVNQCKITCIVRKCLTVKELKVRLTENIPVKYLLFYFDETFLYISLPAIFLNWKVAVPNFGKVFVTVDKICKQCCKRLLEEFRKDAKATGKSDWQYILLLHLLCILRSSPSRHRPSSLFRINCTSTFLGLLTFYPSYHIAQNAFRKSILISSFHVL